MARMLMIFITEQIHMHKNKKQKKTGRDQKAEIVLTDHLKLGVYIVILSICPTDDIRQCNRPIFRLPDYNN